MPVTLDFHQPILVNTLGHSVGVLVFALLVYLFLRDWKGAGTRRSLLPTLAAGLALLWNLSSLAVLAMVESPGGGSAATVASSFAVLSALPALLLHISLGERMVPVRIAGYTVSGIAVCLHVAEGFLPMKTSLHEWALILISAGFGGLTVMVALFHRTFSHTDPARSLPRTMGTMAFFLFAMSFVHFGTVHGAETWSEEIAIHHAGIPLALVVLLQEYRFLLLDTFLRFLANAALAAGIILAGVLLEERYGLILHASADPLWQGLLIVAAGLTLILFGHLRSALQQMLTRVVFRRQSLDDTIHAIRSAAMKASDLTVLLESAGDLAARYAGAERAEWRFATPDESRMEPRLVSDYAKWREAADGNWAEAVMPVWLNQEGRRLLLMGRRQGGRRYLSEDLQGLARIANVIAVEAEYIRASEMKRLVAQAEYRALQAQINPHFLFNSLNALYGTIPRQAEGARRMVLNLSQVFRYFLRSERTVIALSEEIAIVQAYLEIEQLRLGDRLATEFYIEDELKGFQVPVLSIQPLVENAVKHGVASKRGPGWVRLAATHEDGGIRIRVSDSGGDFVEGEAHKGDGAGIGLENVRQRLSLCYGPAVRIEISSGKGETRVGFHVPAGVHAMPGYQTKTLCAVEVS